MNFIFDNDRPIYMQLVEQIKIAIISEKFKIGERLPSVRELAFETKANPNTVQKALQELEDIKLIYTERTNGKYVTNDKSLIIKIKKEVANSNINTYLVNMKKLGISKEEAITYLKNN